MNRLRRVDAVPAADDEPVCGARHADIEQAAIFRFRLRFDCLIARFRQRDPGLAIGLPEIAGTRIGGFDPHDLRPVLPVIGRCAGIDQKDNRRFQSLGGVYRDHPDFVALHVDFALDLRRAERQCGEEGFQCLAARPFMGKYGLQKGVQHIFGLGSQSGQKCPSSTFRRKDMRKELVRSHRGGEPPQPVQQTDSGVQL